MPFAMRNHAIAQEQISTCKRRRICETKDFKLGEYILVKQSEENTLETSGRPHILRVVKLIDSGVVVLQGCDGATVKRNRESSQTGSLLSACCRPQDMSRKICENKECPLPDVWL